jgi:hypothetical protein
LASCVIAAISRCKNTALVVTSCLWAYLLSLLYNDALLWRLKAAVVMKSIRLHSLCAAHPKYLGEKGVLERVRGVKFMWGLFACNERVAAPALWQARLLIVLLLYWR